MRVRQHVWCRHASAQPGAVAVTASNGACPSRVRSCRSRGTDGPPHGAGLVTHTPTRTHRVCARSPGTMSRRHRRSVSAAEAAGGSRRRKRQRCRGRSQQLARACKPERSRRRRTSLFSTGSSTTRGSAAITHSRLLNCSRVLLTLQGARVFGSSLVNAERTHALQMAKTRRRKRRTQPAEAANAAAGQVSVESAVVRCHASDALAPQAKVPQSFVLKRGRLAALVDELTTDMRKARDGPACAWQDEPPAAAAEPPRARPAAGDGALHRQEPERAQGEQAEGLHPRGRAAGCVLEAPLRRQRRHPP